MTMHSLYYSLFLCILVLVPFAITRDANIVPQRNEDFAAGALGAPGIT